MKIKALKPFVSGAVETYLSRDLASAFRDLMLGLQRLTFADNFESFQVDLYIPAGTEVPTRNKLSFIPSRRVIVRQRGGGAIVDGDTSWNVKNLYLKNTGADDAAVTVIFMR